MSPVIPLGTYTQYTELTLNVESGRWLGMMHGDTHNFHLKIPQVYANTGGTTVLCVPRKWRQSGFKDAQIKLECGFALCIWILAMLNVTKYLDNYTIA